MEVHVEQGVRKEIMVTLIAGDEYERRSLKMLNDALRSGLRLEINHHVEDSEGVDRLTMESHRRLER